MQKFIITFHELYSFQQLINELLQESGGMCEYALYVQGEWFLFAALFD